MDSSPKYLILTLLLILLAALAGIFWYVRSPHKPSTPPVSTANPRIVVGTGSGAADGTVFLPVTFIPGATGVSALQFDLLLPSGISYATTTAGDAATAASKGVSSAAIAHGMRVLIAGINQNLIGTGTLAQVVLKLDPGLPSGRYPITPTNTVLSDMNANAVAADNAPGSVTVTGGSPL